MIQDEVVFGGRQMVVLVDKSVFWPEQNLLIISDVHLGKSNHFRKAGIALSQGAELGDLNRIETLINNHQPQTVVFLGDLFHSNHNVQWNIFAQWIKTFNNIQFILVEGNHDLLGADVYTETNIKCVSELIIENICFSHEPIEKDNLYNICGHIHPGIRLIGKANQKARLPCFYIKRKQFILPAFGSLTGLHIIEPRKDELVYGIANSTLYKYGQ